MHRAFAVALLSAFLITGCAARGVRIAELKTSRRSTNTSPSSLPARSPADGVSRYCPTSFTTGRRNRENHGAVAVGRTPAKATRVEVKGRINEFARLAALVGLLFRSRAGRCKS